MCLQIENNLYKMFSLCVTFSNALFYLTNYNPFFLPSPRPQKFVSLPILKLISETFFSTSTIYWNNVDILSSLKLIITDISNIIVLSHHTVSLTSIYLISKFIIINTILKIASNLVLNTSKITTEFWLCNEVILYLIHDISQKDLFATWYWASWVLSSGGRNF